MAYDKKVTNNNFYLYVPNLMPSVETQGMFNEASQNKYKISSDEWYTEKREKSDQIKQLNIGSSQQVNSPKYLIGAHQTPVRADTATKNNKNAIFDHFILKKY